MRLHHLNTIALALVCAMSSYAVHAQSVPPRDFGLRFERGCGGKNNIIQTFDTFRREMSWRQSDGTAPPVRFNLSGSKRRELYELVVVSGAIFDFPAVFTPTPGNTDHPMFYRITVRASGRTHTVEFFDRESEENDAARLRLTLDALFRAVTLPESKKLPKDFVMCG